LGAFCGVTAGLQVHAIEFVRLRSLRFAVSSWRCEERRQTGSGMSQRHVRFEVATGVQAPRDARHRIADCLRSWGFADTGWLDAVGVVVSELVTNAVQHGNGGAITVELSAGAGPVLLSVADDSDVLPRPREPDDRGGRGLTLIEALSSRWQVRDRDGGKCVQVELRPYTAEDGAP
jgi:anti-sigma regulatory factor (Ser/Thr protein kinase)